MHPCPAPPPLEAAPGLALSRLGMAPMINVTFKNDGIQRVLLASDVSAEAAIDAKAAAVPMGGATSGMELTADGLGDYKSCPGGWVLWRADRGALAVYGDIGARWAQSGGVSGGFGWPQTDELGVPRGPGRYNHFDN